MAKNKNKHNGHLAGNAPNQNAVNNSSASEKNSDKMKPKKRINKNIRRNAILISIILVVVFFAVLLFKKQSPNTEGPKKYEEAKTLLNSLLDKKLDSRWFCALTMDSIMPKMLVYANQNDSSIVFENKNRNEKYEVFYRYKDNCCVEVLDDSKSLWQSLIKDYFSNLNVEKQSVEEIASAIGALSEKEYVDNIKKQSDKYNRVLSLVYNTLVGDSKGHLFVELEDQRLKIVRSTDLKYARIDVKALCDVVRYAQSAPDLVSQKPILQILQEKRALDTAFVIKSVYYDRRHDAIVGADSKVLMSRNANGDIRFDELARKIKSKPTSIPVLEDNDVRFVDDKYLSNDTSIIGNLDLHQIQSVHFSKKSNKSFWIIWLALGLVLGFVVSTNMIAWWQRRKKEEQHENLPYIADNPEIKRIKSLLSENNDNASLLSVFENILDNLQQADGLLNEKEKLEKEVKELKEKNNSLNDKINTLKQENNSQKERIEEYVKIQNKIDSIERNYLDNSQKLDKLLVALCDLWPRSDRFLKEKKDELEQCTNKAAFYDVLFKSATEETLLANLAKMREASKGRMAKINALSQLKEESFKNDFATLRRMVKRIDESLEGNLSQILDEMQRKTEWYDAKYDYTAKRSNAYDIIAGTKTTKMSSMDLKKALEGQNLDENEVAWIAGVYEGARQNSATSKFTKTMWNEFVKEFVAKEASVKSDDGKAWYFAMLANIAYHTADFVRTINSPADEIHCYNRRLMASEFDMNSDVAKEYSKGNIIKSTVHSDLVYEWFYELGVRHLKILVDQYAIMP